MAKIAVIGSITRRTTRPNFEKLGRIVRWRVLSSTCGQQGSRRHENEYGNRLRATPLARASPGQVRSETHEHQRKEPDHRCQPAGQDGACGFAEGIHHGRLQVRLFLPALFKAVKQEYRVVQGYGKLQDVPRRVGDKGNLAKNQVGSPVDGDCHTQGRLKPPAVPARIWL